MKPRILYASPATVHGGAEEVLVAFMEAARDSGYEPLLLTPGTGWLTDRAAERGFTTILVPTLPGAFVNSFWQQFRPWLTNAVRIARIIREHRIEIVHANSPRVSYHAGLGARLARVPSVTHVHDIVNLPYKSRLKARLLSSLADRTLAVSQAVRSALVGMASWMEPRTRVLYNGWDVSLYQNVHRVDLRQLVDLPAESLVIGSASSMSVWKGQDVLIEAFARLRERVVNTRLVIVGAAHGPSAIERRYERSLHEKVASMGLAEVVTFTGWREDVWDYISAFDVFVHVPTSPDPLPTALLHAAALKRAIVGSAIGGVPEIIEHGLSGLLVPPRDPLALTEALLKMANDQGLRARLAAGAHERFLRVFSRERMRSGLAAEYTECLSGTDKR